MRAARRLLAAVRQSEHLQPGAPTGLTGLITHRSPRSALLYTYNSTLDHLKRLPETSVYRQSTEALTKHRLKVVESYLPAGYQAWQDQVASYVAKNQKIFEKHGLGTKHTINGLTFLRVKRVEEPDEEEEWDGDPSVQLPNLVDGTLTEEEARANLQRIAMSDFEPEDLETLKLPEEPQLTREQIGALENEIGAGLIEEVIQVAVGEEGLVKKMAEDKV
ncbi:MAG: hypothetical protein INR71_13325 [Terriglobus roseus]|nr:hypothetical protein [Terriglobus roseus]